MKRKNNKKHLSLLVFCMILVSNAPIKAQLKFHTFETLEQLVSIDPKPMVIFIHTDWCKYCHKMEQFTFKNEEVLKLLNNNFYFVSLDAESKNPIRFRNHTFTYIPNGNRSGVHQLALELGKIKGQISYPTLTVLNEKYEIIFQHNSYLPPKKIIKTLHLLTNQN